MGVNGWERDGFGVVLREGGRSHGDGVDGKACIFLRRELRWTQMDTEGIMESALPCGPRETQTQKTTQKEKQM